MNREEFQKRLAELGELAGKNGNRLTGDQVRGFFAAMELSEEQYELIFAYLASRQVIVEGYVPVKTEEDKKQQEKLPLTEEEESFLKSYQADLEQLKLLEEAELLELCRQVEETGDELAKAKLTEQFLPEVLRLAHNFRGREVQLGDLVQEGNVGLMLALETLGMRPSKSPPLEYLRDEICQAISQAVEDDRAEKEAGGLLANRLNDLRDEIKKLTDELERKVSIEELAVYMDMPAEEIENLLKLAGEAPEGGEEKEE
ncbi:sigma factor [Candidatus Merdisoma sp. JLR.KK006]|jgi:DNA-directed RNA polymerase, sigma subunit (sigma70/sigma32)|uniref:sigma factor n=1 Tax=Candidatus Merdisoma sp. JLR.KK006 TaxID=3112626 RepID=UPI002FF110D2